MAHERLVFRVHAIQRMFERSISSDNVREALRHGEIIEDYPNDQPYPSYLILGWVEERPLHVVAADNDEEKETIIITAYEPDPGLWEPGFRQRKS